MKTVKLPTSDERDLALHLLARASSMTKWAVSHNQSIMIHLFTVASIDEAASKLREKGIKCTIVKESNASYISVHIRSFLRSKKRAIDTIKNSNKFGL